MSIREITLLYDPVLTILKDGKRPSWEIEDELAREFTVTARERAVLHPNSRCSVWTNDVAHALEKLVKNGKIKREAKRKSPSGRKRGVYPLT
jgi:hypothetical protein